MRFEIVIHYGYKRSELSVDKKIMRIRNLDKAKKKIVKKYEKKLDVPFPIVWVMFKRLEKGKQNMDKVLYEIYTYHEHGGYGVNYAKNISQALNLFNLMVAEHEKSNVFIVNENGSIIKTKKRVENPYVHCTKEKE